METNYQRPEKPARFHLPKYIERLYLLGALLLVVAGAFALYNSWRSKQITNENAAKLNRIVKDLGDPK